MGCSFSGLNALYDTVDGGGGDVWINDYRFRVLRRLGDAGPTGSSVFLVKEVIAAAAASDGTGGTGPGAAGIARKKGVDPSHISADGTYALKKVLIQNDQQLELVGQEIRVSSQFSHPNLLPLLEHAIIAVKNQKQNKTNYCGFDTSQRNLISAPISQHITEKFDKRSHKSARISNVPLISEIVPRNKPIDPASLFNK